MSRRSRVVSVAFAVALAGCIESPQSMVDYPAFAVGDGPSTISVDDWTVTLTRAELAFGPVYFCAAAAGSSTLCSTAVAEITNVVRVDALSPEPTALGNVHALTGRMQSASYDFGISWPDTASHAAASPVAPRGHSVRLEAEAVRASRRLLVTADVDVTPQYQGQRGVPTAPLCGSGGGREPVVCPDVSSNAYRLEIRFDAGAWLRQLDFDGIADKNEPSFAVAPGNEHHDAILLGIKNLSPPEFRWVSTSH